MLGCDKRGTTTDAHNVESDLASGGKAEQTCLEPHRWHDPDRPITASHSPSTQARAHEKCRLTTYQQVGIGSFNLPKLIA